jgi:hypothetical protein
MVCYYTVFPQKVDYKRALKTGILDLDLPMCELDNSYNEPLGNVSKISVILRRKVLGIQGCSVICIIY